MTERATLERKRLSDLHQIASQLGIKQYRKYRKPELAEMIYKVATEQAASQQDESTTNGGYDSDGHPGCPHYSRRAKRRRRRRPPPHPSTAPARLTRTWPPPRRSSANVRTGAAATARTAVRTAVRSSAATGTSRTARRTCRAASSTCLPDGFGFLRTGGYSQSKGDVYVSTSQIKRFNLRRGDEITGQIRPAREGEKYPAMVRIETVNGQEPQKGRWRPNFDDLTPLYPMERLRLEWKPNDIAPRVIDLVAPIGKGQRGMVVSPPKAGKTTILKQIAQSIAANYPETKLFVVLADERPEEVTDWERSVEEAEVVASTFDQPADNHIAVAELVLERVKRLVEEGEDVVVLLDGITRLSRAYNLAAPASGRILSGGVDSAALYPPKKFFGAARNIENGGSLTILATALVETGSRMDEVIFEEFKGTGNMELRLDRKLANRRIYPAINIEDSSTRKEELLMEPSEAQRVWQVRSILNALDSAQKIELLIQKLKETRTNPEFLRELQRVRG